MTAKKPNAVSLLIAQTVYEKIANQADIRKRFSSPAKLLQGRGFSSYALRLWPEGKQSAQRHAQVRLRREGVNQVRARGAIA